MFSWEDDIKKRFTSTSEMRDILWRIDCPFTLRRVASIHLVLATNPRGYLDMGRVDEDVVAVIQGFIERADRSLASLRALTEPLRHKIRDGLVTDHDAKQALVDIGVPSSIAHKTLVAMKTRNWCPREDVL